MALEQPVRPEIQQVALDCCGMKCPAPILKIAMAAKSLQGAPGLLRVVSDDADFAKDVRAWCRTYKATLIHVDEQSEGSGAQTTAVIGLGGVIAEPEVPATGRSLPPHSHIGVRAALREEEEVVPLEVPASTAPVVPSGFHRIDCRGRLNPLEMVATVAARLGDRPAVLEVLSDAAGFPVQIQAWCRSAQADLQDLSEYEAGHRAVLSLASSGGLARPTASSMPPLDSDTTIVTGPEDALERLGAQPPPGRPNLRQELDLTGLRAPEPVMKMAAHLMASPGSRTRVRADDATFMVDAMAWASATRAHVTMAHQSADGVVLEVSLKEGIPQSSPAVRTPPSQPVGALVASALESAVARRAPAADLSVAASAQVGELVTRPFAAPRENRVAAMIMHNDFENLLSAMMYATTAAAQGKDVVVFFSFWGVNVLRAERPRPEQAREPRNLLQVMMQWMMPRGPSRQPLSQMHMGGVGKGMMQMFMKKNNVMSVEQLIESAVQGNVRFIVCSTSMEIMGIRKRDIMDLPNIEFGGMSTFVELTSQSGASLVF